jgi:hypothetical protein
LRTLSPLFACYTVIFIIFGDESLIIKLAGCNYIELEVWHTFVHTFSLSFSSRFSSAMDFSSVAIVRAYLRTLAATSRFLPYNNVFIEAHLQYYHYTFVCLCVRPCVTYEWEVTRNNSTRAKKFSFSASLDLVRYKSPIHD